MVGPGCFSRSVAIAVDKRLRVHEHAWARYRTVTANSGVSRYSFHYMAMHKNNRLQKWGVEWVGGLNRRIIRADIRIYCVKTYKDLKLEVRIFLRREQYK